MRILVVEDDAIIAAGLVYSLEQEGYEVTAADSVGDAIGKMEKQEFDLFLLDLSLPDGTGYDICKKVKKEKDVPVIFLTAVDDEVNVVMGLDMGADDYVTKPFRIRELMSRIKSVLRRYEKRNGEDLTKQSAKKEEKNVVCIDQVSVHLAEGKVFKHGKELMLTAMEYRLLLIFLQNRGQILSRNQLLEGIWDVSGDFVNDNTLTVYMKRLREKLEDDPADPKLFKTVRGLGYMLMKGE
ncbi:MAG: response regulator transcription factor [Lachnospiraceae bacterium]|nr:response regulator transcription factor [Lachnospiraceae bacterium]